MATVKSEHFAHPDIEFGKIHELELERRSSEVNQRRSSRLAFVESAIKNLMLVHGGAILSLLTFIGNTEDGYDKSSLRWAFCFFGIGIYLGLSTYIGAFMSQYYYTRANEIRISQLIANRPLNAIEASPDILARERKGRYYVAAAIGCANVSLILFIFGAIFALNGIL